MVLLGVRPGGGTPGWHVLGRETFLAPVTLDRRLAGRRGAVGRAPVAAGARPAVPNRDDFDLNELRPCWVSVRDRSERALHDEGARRAG